MIFPDYFPLQCPPSIAQNPNGEYYRLVKEQNIGDNDFMPHVLLYPDRDFSEKLCEACGLSLFTNIQTSDRLRLAVPGFRKCHIAKAILKNEDGKILHTPSSCSHDHFTWWKPVSADVKSLFQIVN